MMDEGSTKRKKKKRGRSLIFKTCFRTSNPSTGKILASDDNLVYCDVNNNGHCVTEPEIKKSPSSRGRLSRLFKAVLFDTAVKKKIGSKKYSNDLTDSVNSSPGSEDKIVKINNTFDENNSTAVKNLEENNSLIDGSNVSPLPSKTIQPEELSIKEKAIEPDKLPQKEKSTEPEVLSATCESSLTSASSPTMSTPQKVITQRTKSVDKKPPLPSVSSGATVKPIPEREPAATNKPTFGVYLFILVGIFVGVVLWMSYGFIRTEPLNVDSDYTNVVVGEEL